MWDPETRNPMGKRVLRSDTHRALGAKTPQVLAKAIVLKRIHSANQSGPEGGAGKKAEQASTPVETMLELDEYVLGQYLDLNKTPQEWWPQNW